MSAFDPLADRPVGDAPSEAVLIIGGPLTLGLTIGAFYSVQLTVSGGTGPYTWAGTGLPPGIVIDSATGLLSGYPTGSGGSYPGNIRATDSLGVVGDVTPQPVWIVRNYAAYPGKIVTDSNIGPYNTEIRTPYGWGVPPGSGKVRTSWVGVEVLHVGASFARLTWTGVEVLHVGASLARLTWIGIEVLRTIGDRSVPRPAPPRHIIMPPEDISWMAYTNQRRKGGFTPTRKIRPVLFTVV